jgi:hypothetical protein
MIGVRMLARAWSFTRCPRARVTVLLIINCYQRYQFNTLDGCRRRVSNELSSTVRIEHASHNHNAGLGYMTVLQI